MKKQHALASNASKKISVLLSEVAGGDRSASDELFSLVYNELHDNASNTIRNMSAGEILQTTDLLHETYLRLIPTDIGSKYNSGTHFYKVAGKAMRQIIIQEIRKKTAAKRGFGKKGLSIDEIIEFTKDVDSSLAIFNDIDALNTALENLENHDEVISAIVNLNFFAGLSFREIATKLNLSKTEVFRKWVFAKTWLRRELRI